MSSPELVKYFDKKDSENQIYVEELFIGEEFIYENRRYKVEEKKKNLNEQARLPKRVLPTLCLRSPKRK